MSLVPEPKYTDILHKISMYSSGKHFFSFLSKSFLQNFSSKLAKGLNFHFIWFFAYSRNSAYFRQNRPILTLNLRSKSARFCGPPLVLRNGATIAKKVKLPEYTDIFLQKVMPSRPDRSLESQQKMRNLSSQFCIDRFHKFQISKGTYCMNS